MAASNHDKPTAHDVPPGHVEMPSATSWPIILAAGVTFLMLGVATNVVFSIVGGVLLVAGIGGWVAQLLPGRGHELEALAEPADWPKPIAPRPGTVEPLKPGVVGYRFQLPEKVHPISAGIKGGIVGGIVMVAPALIWGLWSGNGIWFPVNLLAGMVLPGMDELSVEQLQKFLIGPFALGVVIHIVMSICIGLVYGVILPTLPPIPGGALVLGGLVLPALWTAASHSLMGLVNPLLHRDVEWPWFVVSQFIYGIAASLVIMRSEKIPIAPRGPYGEEGPPSPPQGWTGCIALCALFLSGCSDELPGKPKLADEYVYPNKIVAFDELYPVRCAGCHGADGTLGAGPPLNDPLFAALVSKEELTEVIANGRKGTLMPMWSHAKGGPLTDEQIASLVDGIKSGDWGDKSAEPPLVAPTAPPLSPPIERQGDPQRGEQVFSAACAGCHGDLGEGIRGGAGAINSPALWQLMSDALIRRLIITGRPDLGMPSFTGRDGRDPGFQPLTANDVDDLAAHLATWRDTGSHRPAPQPAEPAAHASESAAGAATSTDRPRQDNSGQSAADDGANNSVPTETKSEPPTSD